LHTAITKHGRARHLPTKHDGTKTRAIVKLDDKIEVATIVVSRDTLPEIVVSRSQQKVMRRHLTAINKITKQSGMLMHLSQSMRNRAPQGGQ